MTLEKIVSIFEKSINWKEFTPKEHSEQFIDEYGKKINWINYFIKHKKFFDITFIINYSSYFNEKEKEYIYAKLDFEIPCFENTNSNAWYKSKNFPFYNITEDIDYYKLSDNIYMPEDFIKENIELLDKEKLLLNGKAPFLIVNNIENYLNSNGRVYSRYSKNKLPLDFIKDNIDKFSINFLNYQDNKVEISDFLIDKGIIDLDKKIFNKNITLSSKNIIKLYALMDNDKDKEYIICKYINNYNIQDVFEYVDLHNLLYFKEISPDVIIDKLDYILNKGREHLVTYIEEAIKNNLCIDYFIENYNKEYLEAFENVESRNSYDYDYFEDDDYEDDF